MNDPIPYATPSPQNNTGQLRLLSILHYIYGAIVTLFLSLFLIFVIPGAFMIGNVVPSNSPAVYTNTTALPNAIAPTASNPIPYFIPIIFGFFALMNWSLGILTIVSGRRIAQRRSRVFSMVIAGINCISFPFGTALGIFTIVVLSKDSVKATYSGWSPFDQSIR